MTSYESERALVYLAEQIIKTFGKDFGLEIQEPKQEPVEPLIEDEEIRKAIQAWAEANEDDSTTMLKYDRKNVRLSTITSQIEFDNCQPFDRLEDGATYTIAELCGEEEE